MHEKMRNYATDKDTIILTDGEELTNIALWYKANKNELYSVNSLLEKGSIVINYSSKSRSHTRICFDFSNDTYDLFEEYVIPDGLNVEHLFAQYNLPKQVRVNTHEKVEIPYTINGVKEGAKKYFGNLSLFIFPVLAFITVFNDTELVMKRKVLKNKAKSKNSKKKSNKKGRNVFQITYSQTLKQELEYDTLNRKKEKETMGYVRKGHWRTVTQKSGEKKKVWIEPTFVKIAQ